MKWSQAICASILVDEFYLLSPHTRSKPRLGRDDLGVPLEPAFRPTFHRRLGASPEAGRNPVPESAIRRLIKLRTDLPPGLYV